MPVSSPGGLWAGTRWAKRMMWKTVEGHWLILTHAGRLKFRSRLVVTGAIVIGRDDGLSSTSLPVTIQMRSQASWRTTTGRADYWGRAQ